MHIVRFSAPLLWALAACSHPETSHTEAVRDLGPESPEASCIPLDSPIPGTPTEIVSLLDGRILVNDGLARRTFLLDGELNTLATLSYEKEGPLGVLDPQDLTLIEDSIVVYADRPSRRLKFISLTGTDRGGVDLPIPPERLIPWRNGLLIAATILSPGQDELLYFWQPEADPAPMGLAPAAVSDWQIRSLANLVLLLPRPDGTVAGLHQFVVSRAFLVHEPDSITKHGVPVAEGMSEKVGWFPNRPFSEEEMLQIATPVLDASPDPATGGVLILTRTGARRGHHSEKAMMRLNGEFDYQGGLRLPVNAGHLVYLSGRNRVVVVTEDDRWLQCTAP